LNYTPDLDDVFLAGNLRGLYRGPRFLRCQRIGDDRAPAAASTVVAGFSGRGGA
jgi:hypothetical protein